MASIQINLDAINNNVDDLSFGLLRANPALSTNVKLVVDSDGAVFMDSFIANKELANNNYRKYPINTETGAYSFDVASYFGNLPNNIKFKAGRVASDYTVYSEYSNQYETQYSYGASFNSTKVYKEQYRFLAPIWLDKNLPSLFVIYRVKGTTPDFAYSETQSGQNARIVDMLKNATIVKSYNLTETSNVGKYLRNHVTNQQFPVSPISHNYEQDQVTHFRGIDVDKGGFADRKEDLHDDFVKHDNLEIFSNEIFSNGFERNKVAIANLINLEFLFDDFKADNYDIYRYFGVFVNPAEEGSFDIDRIVDTENREGIFLNENSVVSYLNRTGTALTHVDMLPKYDELRVPSLNWVKSKDGDYYHIRNNEVFKENDFLPVSINKSTEEEFKGSTIVNTIQVEDFSINLKDFIKLEINSVPVNGNKLFIAPYTELKSVGFDLTEFIIAADNTLPAGTSTVKTFSCNGTTSDVARAIAGCVSQTEYGYKVTYDSNKVIIEDYASGSNRKMTLFGSRTANLPANSISVVDGIISTKILQFHGEFTSVIGSNIINVTLAMSGAIKPGQFISDGNSTHIPLGTKILGFGTNTSTASTISGTSLTIGGSVLGSFGVGQTITGVGVSEGTMIIGYGTGSGGAGTYYVNNTQSVSSTSINSNTSGGVGNYSISANATAGDIEMLIETFISDADGLPTYYYSDWNMYYPLGGALKNNALLVKSENKGVVSVGDLVKSMNAESYSKILQIVEDPYTSGLWRIIFEKAIQFPKSKSINIYQTYKNKFGRFQIFDIKDFDFDFYDTSNSNLEELDTEQKYIQTSHQYYKYDEATGPDFKIDSANYYSNLLPVSTDDIIDVRSAVEKTEGLTYPVGSLYAGLPLDDVLSKSGEIEIFNETLSSEYDRLRENEIKETAVLGRVIPTISKFVLKDGFNARMKEYPLSVNEAFGVNNMSPSLDGYNRSPDLFNMEHFHINRIPSYMLADNLNLYKNKSYLDFGIGRPLSLIDLQSTNFNFFDKYFIWNGGYTETAILIDIKTEIFPQISAGVTTNYLRRTYTFNAPPFQATTTIVPTNTAQYTDPATGIVYAIGTFRFPVKRLGNNYAYFKYPITFSGNTAVIEFPKTDSHVYNDDAGLYDLKIGDVIAKNVNSLGEAVGGFTKNKKSIRYSKFSNGGNSQNPSTVFRGLRYIFKSRKENQLQIPKEFIQTSEVNGYKFGFVINHVVFVDPTISTSKDITVVKNDKFKFICIYINLTLQNNLVRSLSRKVFYELNNAKLSSSPDIAINTSVDGALEFNDASWNNFEGAGSGYTILKGITGTDGATPKFKSQINVVNGQYSYLIFSIGATKRVLKVVRVVGDDSIIVQGYPREWDGLNPNLEAGQQWNTVVGISDVLQKSLKFTYYEGGDGAFTEIFESLNAKRFTDLINTDPSQVDYITVKEDGTTLNNQFVLNIEDGVEIIKLSSLATTVDNDKPKSYKVTADEVGKNIIQREDQYFTILKRMNGDYSPKFKDVLYFEEINPANIYYTLDGGGAPIKNKSSILYNLYNNTGIVFGSYYQNSTEDTYALIKNYHYHKVNPEASEAVLKLSVSSDKLPLYPKIGEIAIGKKDMNILKSKYEDDYFIKSLPNNKYETTFGTISPIEKSSFLASTVMKVDDVYTLSRFNAIQTTSLDELNNSSIKASKDNSIFWFEDDSKVYIDVYLRYALLDELIENGINNKFNKYIVPSKSYGDITTIDDDLVKYVDSNIVPRFIIDTVELYAKEGKDITTSFLSVQDVTSIDQVTYSKQSSYSFTTFAEDRLGFRLIYNKKPGYKYQFIPAIKIIA